MKNLLQLMLLTSAFIATSANASLNIKNIELNDSSIVNGFDISAITIDNDDSTINSIEKFDGEIINSSEIKLIHFLRVKMGGEDSGG